MTDQNTENSERLMNYAAALQIILITLLFVPFTPIATHSVLNGFKLATHSLTHPL